MNELEPNANAEGDGKPLKICENCKFLHPPFQEGYGAFCLRLDAAADTAEESLRREDDPAVIEAYGPDNDGAALIIVRPGDFGCLLWEGNGLAIK